MKRKDLILLVGVAVFTAIIAFVLSTAVFKIPKNRSTKVPVAGSIDSQFPDVKHDSTYNTIFNNRSIDPTVPLDASNAPNNQPFNGSNP